MIGAVWGSGVDVAGDQATIAANKRWQSKLITSSGTWVVPADVGVIWVDGCSGGGGGGGGDSTPGGGGSGGGMGGALRNYMQRVTPGTVLTITVGAGGNGGTANNNGGYGGSTAISVASTPLIWLMAGQAGNKGTAVAGGSSEGAMFASNAIAQDMWPAINYVSQINYFAIEQFNASYICYTAPTNGGALSANGGARTGRSIATNSGYSSPSIGGTAGGGGGHGALGPYTSFDFSTASGIGGSDGAAGGVGGGYGSGGGGGSGNSAGGNGSPGFICIYAFSATTI